MAITTLAGAISGLQRPFPFAKVPAGAINEQAKTLWNATGFPSAGGYDTTLNGVTLSGSSSNVLGQIPFTDPASGNTYLAALSASTSVITKGLPTLVLADRLWHNGGITNSISTAQAITSPTWPARDAAGTTNGDGVLLAVEFSSASNLTPGAMTVSYTNSSGVSGRTASTIIAPTSFTGTGDMLPFALQAGDTGVQSVQSFTLSSPPSAGTFNLVAYREIARLSMQIESKSYKLDLVSGCMPRIYNGSVLYCWLDAINWGGQSSTTPPYVGSIQFTQG